MTKPISQNFLRVFLVSVVFFLPTFTIASQADDEQAEQPRWFEIEIILYKATSEEGLTNESWDTNINMMLPEELIDFLQPFGLPGRLDPEQQQSEQHSLQRSTKKNNKNNATSLNSAIDDSTINDSSINGVATNQNGSLGADLIDQQEEQPFVLLEQDWLQLKTEALNISRHVSYELLAHFSWRQPVLRKKESTSLRIAGGFDYQQTFEYSGEQKFRVISAEESQLLADAEPDNIKYDNIKPDYAALKSEASQLKSASPSSDLNNPDNQSLAALPWVPEIDGSILIYIHRNYLHLDTNLFYRRPGKEEVNIFEFQDLLPSLDSIDETISPDTGFDINQQPIERGDFSWQYDGSFLSDDTEKNFTERLFNYPLKQNRRLRSKQLNYFDHPLIGMLVMIRPYEINMPEQQVPNAELITNQ